MTDGGHPLYERLVGLLRERGAGFREIAHAPEGRTDRVSRLRGHVPARAAKCLILMVRHGKRRKRFVLAVVPGDRQVDVAAVKALLAATWVGFAPRDLAEELAGSPAGTVLPFAFDERLELLADPALLDGSELYFNAARLDRSLALASDDWRRIAAPRLAPIASAPVAAAGERRRGGPTGEGADPVSSGDGRR